MKNALRKFYRRIGKTRFLILCFIPFGVWGFCSNGWLGLFATMFGWWLGSVIYNWRENKRRLKNFFRTNTEIKVKSIILIPVVLACVYHSGWKGLIAALVGIVVGEFICRRFIFKKR